MRAGEALLADLAESVADGTAPDWQAADSQDDVRVRRLAGHLRLVDRIATLHRSIPDDDASAADVTPGPTVRPDGEAWGRLVLRERIGEGTSGDVYRAWDSDLELDVALKLLRGTGSPDAERRVIEEARRLARVRHHHVVQVYGAEKHDRRVGLWMELVDGRSLERVVQERGPWGANEAALSGLDICGAVGAVHEAGLLHRDIKAQNVLRENGGRIVLMDFGTGEDLAGTNRIVGTPLYLAPEIFFGARASVQSDVYSIGVLLFYLVTGAFPVTAASMQDLARAHRRGDRRRLRDLRPDAPEGFVRALEPALDSDPGRRYRSVAEFEEALREALISRGQAPLSAPDVPPPPAPPRTGVTTRLVVMAVVGLIALLALALFLANLVRS
ncbi:MAG TPA: serine/threonine-protein kinase [Vicinamibacterales bacterium]|nr:serine/threonine-protein kinase [Vicinamibacterales bacterium]